MNSSKVWSQVLVYLSIYSVLESDSACTNPSVNIGILEDYNLEYLHNVLVDVFVSMVLKTQFIQRNIMI